MLDFLWRLVAVIGLGVMHSPCVATKAGGYAPADGKPNSDGITARTDCHGDPLPEGAVSRLGTVRLNHGAGLNSLYFLPDGKTIVSEGRGVLCRWDAVTGKELARFPMAKPSFDDQTALSADGKTLVLLNQESSGDTVRIVDLANGKEVRVKALPVRRFEFGVDMRNALSQDGSLCATFTRNSIRVFEAATGTELCQLPNRDRLVRAIAFAGNDRIIVADKERRIGVWDIRTGTPIREFRIDSTAVSLATSPDGRKLATLQSRMCGTDERVDRDAVHIWDVATGARKVTLAARPNHFYRNVQFSADGDLLLAGGVGPAGGELVIWDVPTGRCVRELAQTGTTLAISLDGSRLASGGSKFELWDLKSGRRLTQPDSDYATVATLFFSPAGNVVRTVGNFSISTWDAASSQHLHSMELSAYPSLNPQFQHSPNGRYAATFEQDERPFRIIIWDIENRRRLHTLEPPGTPLSASAFSCDSRLFATWHSEKEPLVRLWDVGTGKEIHSFRATGAGVPAELFFAPDGKTLFVIGHKTAAYDIATGRDLFSWKMRPIATDSKFGAAVVGGRVIDDNDRIAWRSLAFSPDGTAIAAILSSGFGRERIEDRIALYEPRTGRVIRRWNDSGNPSLTYEQLNFSPDGRLLASSDDDIVHVWEVATGREIRTFRGHRAEIRALAFSSNGRRLASSSLDRTVLIWDLSLRSGGHPESQGRAITDFWEELTGEDAARAYDAQWRLAAVPEVSVPYIAQRLKPATQSQVQGVRRPGEGVRRGASSGAGRRAGIVPGVPNEAFARGTTTR
jgi:WD40 repeat protein